MLSLTYRALYSQSTTNSNTFPTMSILMNALKYSASGLIRIVVAKNLKNEIVLVSPLLSTSMFFHCNFVKLSFIADSYINVRRNS